MFSRLTSIWPSMPVAESLHTWHMCGRHRELRCRNKDFAFGKYITYAPAERSNIICLLAGIERQASNQIEWSFTRIWYEERVTSFVCHLFGNSTEAVRRSHRCTPDLFSMVSLWITVMLVISISKAIVAPVCSSLKWCSANWVAAATDSECTILKFASIPLRTRYIKGNMQAYKQHALWASRTGTCVLFIWKLICEND